jgi:exodeoxyribonuclease V alpha subunit
MTGDAASTRSSSAPDGGREIVDGVVERITYVNEENAYTVARFKLPRQKRLATIAGVMPGIAPGEGLRIEGHWIDHPNYGRQFLVEAFQTAAPGTVPALKRYLGSGLLRGVGPVVAEHIVNTFGLDTLRVLDEEPDRLREVPGMGAKRAQAIAATWRERRLLQNLMVSLQDEGLPVPLVVRILKKYGSAAEAVVRDNPYRLSAEVYGFSFATADAIARRHGFAADDQRRFSAGTTHLLRAAAAEGHSFLAVDRLIASASELLSLPADRVRAALPDLQEVGAIQIDVAHDGQPIAYAPQMYVAERGLAQALHLLQTSGRSRLVEFASVDWRQAWEYVDRRETISLSEAQRGAIQAVLTRRVVALTGGPGTGKTTTLRGIVRLTRAKGKTVVLAAPTGRAAKRLSEATGVQAMTLHRLLQLRPNGGYEVRTPIEADLVIVDEASMMDLLLAQALVEAVPPGAHLLLVGDVDQLPPVGPGAVFRDVVSSGTVPVVSLHTIFRQRDGSAIVENAHRINCGEPPVTGKAITDFFLFRQPDPEAAAQLVVDLTVNRVPTRFGLNPDEDIQVLAPVYGGSCGVDTLNTMLQAALNPPDPTKDERRYGNTIYRVGDRVMQLVNDYDRQVFNGDVGRIVRIDLEEREISVSFDGESSAVYGFGELDELTLAYAISIHKAQGSEYRAVIVPVLRQHGRALDRSLIYTAVSRARELVVLVGDHQVLARAVSLSRSAGRNSNLATLLSDGVGVGL